jgi:hypothetical protein
MPWGLYAGGAMISGDLLMNTRKRRAGSRTLSIVVLHD